MNLRMIALGLIAMTLAGCESTRWNWFKPNSDVATKPGAPSSAAGLVNYLNTNAGRIRTMRVEDMSIDVTMGNQPIGLRGRVYAERERNFRMKVNAFGKDEVDIGSNRDEFWFWAAKNPEPYQYFCSYDDLNQGRVQSMPLPVQPEWVMEAMGMGAYGEPTRYTLEPNDSHTVRLVEKTRSPQGKPVRKVIVMNRKETKAPTPQVTAFLLIDEATNKEICSAHITATKVDRDTGAIVPYKMELRMPGQNMKMTLKLDGMTVNSQIPATAFARQTMSGVESFNLATGRPEPRGLLPAQGFQK